jgi:hypothetical protein
MTASLLLSALGLLTVPGVLRPLARRLPPAEWAALCALLLAAGAIVFEVVAVLVAIPTLMRAVGLREIADLCQEALGRLIPGGHPSAGPRSLRPSRSLAWPSVRSCVPAALGESSGLGPGRWRGGAWPTMATPWWSCPATAWSPSACPDPRPRWWSPAAWPRSSPTAS